MNPRAAIVLFVAIAACAPAQPPIQPSKKSAETAGAAKKIDVSKNITMEIAADGKRRVLVESLVCLREGPLEMFMCRRYTKEHESVVCAEMDARDLHKALLLAGAVAGSPVKFEPKYQSATGSVIKVKIRYIEDGKEKTIDARNWVRDAKTSKELDKDWVFGGSFFFTPEHQDEKAPKRELYAANGGEVVCVSNFGTAMMDLPIPSSDQNDELAFEAFAGRIPPLGTKVTVIFEPEPAKNEGKGPAKPLTPNPSSAKPGEG